MIHSLSGTVVTKRESYFTLDVHGVVFKLHAAPGTLATLPDAGSPLTVQTYLYVREDTLELYGFLTETERILFERLNAVSGIGPKSALGVLGVAKPDQLVAAINEGRAELLTRASGIGKKTADRVILELKGKLSVPSAPQTLQLMESDVELEETLVALGYTRVQAKGLVGKVDPKTKGFPERLREALRYGKPR
jgi:Holliday junction DNA helicase RuvA